MDINDIATRHYEWVEQMGWHNKTVLEALALIASEVGEAAAECGDIETMLAALARITESIGRAANQCRKGEVGENFGVELADIILRTLDLAKWQQIDIDAVIKAKIEKNTANGTRGRKI